MDNDFAAAAAAAARRHRHIEANRRHRVRPGIEQALKRVWQTTRPDHVMAAAAKAKELGCAEMREHIYVKAVVAAAKADAAETRRAAEAEEWGEPSPKAKAAAARRRRAARRTAEAVAAAAAKALGPELTDMAVAMAGNDAPAVLRWMVSGDTSQLPAGMTVTYSQ